MKRFLISNIFICLIIIPNASYSKVIDVGLLISSWGSGIEGDYIFKDDINFGGNYHSTTMDIDSSGTSVKVKGNLKFKTFELYARYFFRGLEFTNGFFGQGGIAIRDWKVDADYTEISTGDKVASIEMKWNPLVLTTGLGWGKIWDNGFSFKTSIVGLWGGKREIEYTENLYKIEESSKKDLEDVSNIYSKINLFLGYSF